MPGPNSRPPSPDHRLHRGFLAAAFAAGALALVVWTLARMSLDRSGSDEAAMRNLVALWPVLAASALCWIGLTILWRQLCTQSPRADDRCSVESIVIILGVAVAARLAVLLTHQPTLSDDVFRYVFDGRNLAHGLNPYLTDPADRAAALADGGSEHWLGESELIRLLAYPEITTPYLPTSQYLFAALGHVCEWGGWTRPNQSALVFRVAFTLIELAMLVVLLCVLRRMRLSPRWLALYAWHPLALDSVAASGHQDILGIALMVAAMAILPSPSGRGVGGQGAQVSSDAHRSSDEPPIPQPSPKGRGGLPSHVVAAVLLAMGVMVKPIAALAGLMWLRRQPLRMWVVSIVVGSIVCIALALPLHWWPGSPPFEAWKGTADWMAEKAAHFGGVYEPVLTVVRHAMPDGPDRKPGFNLEQEWLARQICMGVLAIALLTIFAFARDIWRATAAAMLAIVLCSTTCHPWYLLWAFALFPAGNRSWTLWTYALTISWGYAVFVTGKGHWLGVEWTVAPWIIAIAYIPVWIALAFDGFAAACRWRRASRPNAAT